MEKRKMRTWVCKKRKGDHQIIVAMLLILIAVVAAVAFNKFSSTTITTTQNKTNTAINEITSSIAAPTP